MAFSKIVLHPRKEMIRNTLERCKGGKVSVPPALLRAARFEHLGAGGTMLLRSV